MKSKQKRRQRGAGRPMGGDSDQTRQSILDAARHCFGELGFKETSNKMIAERAHLTSGTIYHYFDNKQDLFLSAHKGTQEKIWEYIHPTLEQKTFPEALSYMLDAFQTLYTEEPTYSKFNSVVRSEMRRNGEIRDTDIDRKWRKFFNQLTELGVSSGEIAPENRQAIKNVLSVIILGVTQHGMEASEENHVHALRGIELLFASDLVRPKK